MARSSLPLLVLLPLLALGQPFQWTTFTSTSNTVDLLCFDGSIWTATSGGLSKYDVSRDVFEVYTNTRGLAMNQSTAVGQDAHGWIWVSHADGRITRLNPESGSLRQIIALEGEIFSMNRILRVGERVFIAADNGIYRFEYNALTDNYVVIESIQVLGGFPGETEVLDIAAMNGYLYAATASGLARADLSNELLSAPAAWENFTISNSSIPQNNVQVLFGADDGKLWLAGPTYTFWFDGDTFHAPVQFNDPVVEFAQTPEGVYAATEFWVFQFIDDNWAGIGYQINSITSLKAIEPAVETDSGTETGFTGLVVGIGDNTERSGGILLFDTLSVSDPIHASGIGGNQVSRIQLDPAGKVWVTTIGDRKGVNRYDGQTWDNLVQSAEYNHSFFRDDPRNIVFDNEGGAWIASQGGGALWIRQDSLLQVFDQEDESGFSSEGQRLRGIAASPGFVITRVARNARGDVFISNRIAGSGTGPVLARVSAEWIAQGNQPDPWEYFYPEAVPGSNPTELEEIIADRFGRVWMGAVGPNNYSFVLESQGAPADSSDDDWFAYNPQNNQDGTTCFPDLLPEVNTWAIDQQNYLWVGTPGGAYYLQGGIPSTLSTSNLRFICLFDMPVGNRVNDIHIDSYDNKWFATDEGIAVLDRNFTWIHVFQTATSVDNPSNLTSNGVTSIASNSLTGEFWIGTQDGLSRLTTPYVSRDMELDEVRPYPNPFRADGLQRLYVDPQRLGGRFEEARIYTITGRLVNKLSWSEMITGGWDGRNKDGSLVAGGVYLVVTTSADGHSATGKIAVLGK